MSNIDINKWIKVWKALLCGSFVISIFQDHLSGVAAEGNIGECGLIRISIWRKKRRLISTRTCHVTLSVILIYVRETSGSERKDVWRREEFVKAINSPSSSLSFRSIRVWFVNQPTCCSAFKHASHEWWIYECVHVKVSKKLSTNMLKLRLLLLAFVDVHFRKYWVTRNVRHHENLKFMIRATFRYLVFLLWRRCVYTNYLK